VEHLVFEIELQLAAQKTVEVLVDEIVAAVLAAEVAQPLQ
jgi:hypothetical protein